MTARDGHGDPQGPTTTTQFSTPCATSYTNGVNGNNPGTLAQNGDSVRLNAALNGAIANKADRCIHYASRAENIPSIDDIYIGTIKEMWIFDATGLSITWDPSMTSEPFMTAIERHDEPQSPTTATQFSPARATSYRNGNHPGTRKQDGDSVRLNAAPNVNELNENHPGALAQDVNLGRLNAAPHGAMATNTYR
jgi:hypothetical protein